MKTAVSIPDPIFEEADALAQALGVSRSELYARALKRYVARHRGATVTEALNRVYASESSELDPVIVAIQAASLPREAW